MNTIKKVNTSILSAASTFVLLKLSKNKIDPFTRAFIGTNLGICTAALGSMTENQLVKTIGIGIALGGALTLEEIVRLKGAKIVSNKFGGNLYTLHETEGVKKLAPGTVPNYRVDGVTLAGLNGVFKAYDGVYFEILSNGIIQPNSIAGNLINSVKAGFKSKAWAEEQARKGDSRWLELYNAGQQYNQ